MADLNSFSSLSFVTSAKIYQQNVSAFYDWEYGRDNYAPAASPVNFDSQKNCFGYALGYNAFIFDVQSAKRIIADDGWVLWTPPGSLEAGETRANVLALYYGGHAALYSFKRQGPTRVVVKAEEQYRASGVYTKQKAPVASITPKDTFYKTERGPFQQIGPVEYYVKGGDDGGSEGDPPVGGPSVGGL